MTKIYTSCKTKKQINAVRAYFDGVCVATTLYAHGILVAYLDSEVGQDELAEIYLKKVKYTLFEVGDKGSASWIMSK